MHGQPKLLRPQVAAIYEVSDSTVRHYDKGKKREVLDRFFEHLTSEQKSRVEAVGIDRSGTYQSSIQAHLPEAAIVYDRVHLMMNLNQAVDQVRRE